MNTTVNQQSVQTVCIQEQVTIDAPIEIAFEAVLEECGPGSVMPDGSPFPMKLEPWPGGRWFRDLGNNTGHYWGQVQVIKPPKLLEICGPFFMSYPAMSHVQYRLTAEGDKTVMKLTHRAMGLIDDEHLKGMGEGWKHGVSRVKLIAEQKVKGGTR